MSVPPPPGVVIAHSARTSGCYLGCPAIVVLPDGAYVVSHSFVGPGTTNTDSAVYRSSDGGASWDLLAHLDGQVWSSLFLHDGSLYLLGTDHRNPMDNRINGRVVIRRSADRGETWSIPTSAETGRLTEDDGWHTAPVAVVEHRGRLWRGMEFAPTRDRVTWRALAISADRDADLLDRSSWQFSQQVESERLCQWIEGNAVVTPDDRIAILIRRNRMDAAAKAAARAEDVDRAVLLDVSEHGDRLQAAAESVIQMPGGGTKFTVRFDPGTGRYLALVNPQSETEVWRNILCLASSPDLRHWRIDRELVRHQDAAYHAVQYVDWCVDGEDLVFVSRTAWDDDHGGPARAHDANFITFHRLERFRSAVGSADDSSSAGGS